MSFGLIGGSSFGRPNIGWKSTTSNDRSKQRAISDKRSGGRMGGKNFHELPGSPMYSGGAPKQTERVNYGPRDVSLSAKGKHAERMKATRLHKFNKSNNGGDKSMKNFKQRGKYSSNGGGRGGNNGRSSFSFDKSVNNGISHLEMPTSQNVMGGGAHLQSLELPSSKYDDTKLFVKNIELKPTGQNLPKSDIFKFFSSRVFPAYITMLQERVNYKIELQSTEFQLWFFNIQEALNLWFYVNSVLSYYDNNPAGNEGMASMRNNISSEALNLYDQLGKVLETKVIDPSMLKLIRYIHDVYQCSPTNPQSALIKFSYSGTMGEDSVALVKSLDDAINNLANVDLLKVNSLMKKAKPEWTIKLEPYDGKAKYDEDFLTFWANIPEKYNTTVDGVVKPFMKPYIKTTNGAYADDAQFGIYGNDYSVILNGLTCFNVSADGSFTQTTTTDTVHTGFIQPELFGTVGTSNLRWNTIESKFVPAGLGDNLNQQIEACMSNPSNVVMRFKTELTAEDNWPYTPLKPQCQEPITMNVESTRQDFNHAMDVLFNWTNL